MANDFVRFARSVEYSTGKKRGRHPVFNANRFYPHALERELASLAKSELERFLSECTEAALVGIPVRDDMEDLSKVPETIPESFAAGVGGVAEKMRRKASTDFAEWSEMVVGKPYYPPEAEREIFSTWTANFQTLCKSAEADAKKDISLLVSSAKNEGWNRGRLEKSIRERLPSKYRARAENIARTELGKLNSAAKLSQFRKVGISYYKWLTTIDGRERDSHRSMNGLICSVSNPDVYYTENPDDPLHPVEHPRTAGMFRGNPGEDFQCRCSMVAWDPEIDGMYEVRESPEGPDGKEEPGTSPESAESARLGAELEKARREQEKAETALKNAENAKREAERKLEILRAANSRHAARTVSDSEKIRKFRKWRTEMPKDLREKEKTAMAENWLEIEKKLGIAKGNPMSVEEADKQSANPNYSKGEEYRINCQTCAPAYMLRLCGFNIKAKGNIPGSLSEWISHSHSFDIWKNIDGSKPKASYYNEFLKQKGYKKMTAKRYTEFFEESCKEEGIYVVTIAWKGNGGHATILQRLNNGKLVYIEPQCFNGIVEHSVEELSTDGTQTEWKMAGRGVMRIDNKIFDKKYLSIFEK